MSSLCEREEGRGGGFGQVPGFVQLLLNQQIRL